MSHSTPKKCAVYAVGHALLDTEISVTDDVLAEIGVNKSEMQLIDANRLSKLKQTFCADTDNIQRHIAGSAVNTLLMLSGLSQSTALAATLAKDKSGDFYQTGFSQTSKHPLPQIESADWSTGECLVFVTPDSERTMCTHLGASQSISPEYLDTQLMTESSIVYLEGYLLSHDNGFRAAQTAINHCSRSQQKIALTLSDVSMVNAFRPRFDALLEQGVDLIFCNENEALAMSGESDPTKAIQSLHTKARGALIVMTQHDKGASIYDGEALLQVEGYPVKAVDALGAGDAFSGAFMAGLIANWPKEQSARFANYAASIVVSHWGPSLSADNMQPIVEQYHKYSKASNV